MFVENFAEAIRLAQKIYEESFQKEKYGGKYKKSHEEAALEACEQLKLDERYQVPIMLLNYCAWNDIQKWIKDINP